MKLIYESIFMLLTIRVVLGKSYFQKSNPSIPGNGLIFYDMKSNSTLLPPIIEKATLTGNKIILRQDNMGQPCNCFEMTCSCCAGLNIQQFNINQNMCTNLTYDPLDFSIIMNILLNEKPIYENSVSAKNPPPVCVPVPLGPIPIGIDMCVKMFNIFTPGNNLHLCMDLQARIQKAPFVVLHFECVRMGQDGFAFLKPEDNGGVVGGGGAMPEPAQENADVFDPVTEIKKNLTIESK